MIHPLYLLPLLTRMLSLLSQTVCSACPILTDLTPLTLVWEKASAAVEIAQGKAIADAAVTAGTHLLIWSSLPNVTRMTSGQITGAKHFDSKAEVEVYIRGLPIKSMFFMPGWFMQNHLVHMRPELVRDCCFFHPVASS